ncbi:hypothetical protein [Teichococcus aestuarii]|uniref:hypothetical protein n=1 Tax=Teichococcus aestuarii TaxID=568898 RepID=UPI0036219F15
MSGQTLITTIPATVNAPAAPIAVEGAELAAIDAIGAGGFLWRAETARNAGQASFIWRDRIRDVPLAPYAGNGPAMVADGAIQYLNLPGNIALDTPAGVSVMPYESQTHFALIRLPAPPSAALGVLFGNRRFFDGTAAATSDNVRWLGMTLSAKAVADDIGFHLQGNNTLVTMPDADVYQDDSWHLIEATFTKDVVTPANNLGKLFADGVQRASANFVSAGGNALIPYAGTYERQLRVGAAGTTTPQAYGTFGLKALAIVPEDLSLVANAARRTVVRSYLGGLVGLPL